MNEREMFLQTWEREYNTTLRVMQAYPSDKADIKPADKSKSARDLLWVFVSELSLIEGICKGQIDFMNMPKPPDAVAGIVPAYQAKQLQVMNQLKNMTEQEWNLTIPFMVAPKQMGQVKRGDLLWTMLLDSVHHRGQLSVYLRIAGAKVPSIYGPTADEPWM